MCAAASVGNTNRLQSYLLAGADLSQKDVSGRTPLHFAALHNHPETIEFLLEHGADPHCLDMLGQTAAELAETVRAENATRLLAPFRRNIKITLSNKNDIKQRKEVYSTRTCFKIGAIEF